ncbi:MULTISPECIES: HAD-IC family P-type ATPase [Streptomyces]|uniref:HAD-IC family P-type ATPase n=1 Tax=Streptomyces TaxID=1883 RepID=UPI00163C546C|nr:MULTISPECIES: cation-translocating P-type ATPase [Streptomyces]MBC2876323.1 HAD-IC family P-type ATPase [Streptomyces sp. TYQ1024]UBI35460.1 HAD-IC family P-type ATPase [Streptomyces mobaraensis]UKW28052.1 HAD-IC family P-type ATPase [Streptomyces sp. TYQ1024]
MRASRLPVGGRGPEKPKNVREVPVGSWSALVPALVGAALRDGPVRAWDTAAGALDWGRRTAGEALSSLTTAVASGLAEAGAALAEGGRDRTRRRMWTSGGRTHLEVRGLGRGERHDRLAAALCEALHRLEGVNWAEVNAVLGHLVIDADEDRFDPADALELVERLEDEHAEHLGAGPFDADGPRPPFDTVPATLAKVALAADCVGLVCATARRLSPLPALPPALRLPAVLAETQPRLRRLLEDRLGREHADVLLAASNAATHALTRGAGPLALDLVHRVWQLAEIRARQDVWALREPELVGGGADLPRRAPERAGRPVPLPDGPVESCGRRTALTALAGAGGLLAWTRDPERAARTVVATAPKAAEAGREAFAARLGRDLARAGALPLDPGALRRLDRVTTVLFDAPVLCAPRPRLLSAVATGELDEAALWSVAHRVLARFAVGELSGPGPWTAGDWRLARARDAPLGRPDAAGGLTLDLWGPDGTRAGRILVGCALDPLADALLAVARGPTRRVLLTEHASAAELLPRAHRTVPAGVPLCDEVRRLQRDGEVVLLVAQGDAAADRALAAADVAVTAPPRPGAPGRPCWSADLVCGPGTALVWRTLAALEPAREVSAASARLSLGGSLLGALIATGGARSGRAGLATSPVHGAALLAMAGGMLAARRVAGRPLPPGRVRGTWHALGAWETLSLLRASAGPESRDGPEQPAPPRTARRPAPLAAAVRGPGRLLGAVREELRDPLTPVLTLGAAASVAVGSTVDSALVGGVMTGNALISGVQRLRAERALSGLLLAERPVARRLNWSPAPDGLLLSLAAAPVRTVPADELRPGDVVALGPTDVVPADARLLAAERLELDESPLTGESAPVPKGTRATPGADLADRSCMVYQGCTVLAGSGYAVVTATGAQTEAGRAADLVGEATAAPGIEAHLAALTRAALPAVGLGGGAVTLLGLVRGVPLRQAVASGVAIAVAAVPEGLPLVATVAQSAAARRLSRHGVLTRSARALEALGRVDTVCFDKTGTLTRGRLSVTRVALPGQDPPPLDSPAARRLLRTAARACPPPVPDRPPPHATDRAVLDAAAAHASPDPAWHLTAELPFETARGYSASLGTDAGTPLLAVKGAPETVLARCTAVTTGDGTTAPLDAARLRAAQESVQELARDGLRVLAVAEARPTDAGGGVGGRAPSAAPDAGTRPAGSRTPEEPRSPATALDSRRAPEAAGGAARLADTTTGGEGRLAAAGERGRTAVTGEESGTTAASEEGGTAAAGEESRTTAAGEESRAATARADGEAPPSGNQPAIKGTENERRPAVADPGGRSATTGADGGTRPASAPCGEARPAAAATARVSRAAGSVASGGSGSAGTAPDGDARAAATGPRDAATPGGTGDGGTGDGGTGDGGTGDGGTGAGDGCAGPELPELVRDLTLLGFLALADTPRPGAAETVRRLTEAGTRVVMITGDHPATAAAVARELGVPAGDVVTGHQLDTLPEPERTARVVGATVFARVSPEQKAGIVHALRSAGRVVAMTGDGINDAAAIRLADVGIGLSAHGSTSARAAADLVLAEPDPRRIVTALLEGRALWRSVRDAVAVLVGGNAGEVAFTVLGTAVSGRAPLGTRQFLLVNLLTDMLPALAIAVARTGAAEDDEPAAGPVPAPLGRDLARALAVRGAATALGAAAAWQCGRATGRAGRAGTMGLAALVLTQLGQTLTTDWRSPLVLTTAGLSTLALVGVVQTPGVSHFFGCSPLGPVAWGTVLGTSAAATLAAALAPRVLGGDGTPPVRPLSGHRPPPDRPPPDRASSNRTSPDRASSDRMSSGRARSGPGRPSPDVAPHAAAASGPAPSDPSA